MLHYVLQPVSNLLSGAEQVAYSGSSELFFTKSIYNLLLEMMMKTLKMNQSVKLILCLLVIIRVTSTYRQCDPLRANKKY